MKWIVNLLSADNNSNFILNNDSGGQMLIKYTQEDHSVSIDSPQKIKRTYFQEHYGILTNGFLFRNEYGVEIGKMARNMWNKEKGYIQLYHRRFFYNIKKIGTKIGLTVFDNRKMKVCETEIKPEEIQESNAGIINEYSGILFSVCWFLTETAFSAEI